MSCNNEMPELLQDCERFFDSWFGPTIGAPEHLPRIEERRKKIRAEFADILAQFVRAHINHASRAAPLDVESLKLNELDYGYGEGENYAEGWNAAIDHLHAQGWLTGKSVPADVVERVAATIEKAAKTFRWYEELHAAKPDPEKAKRNAEFAEEQEAGLAALAPYRTKGGV